MILETLNLYSLDMCLKERSMINILDWRFKWPAINLDRPSGTTRPKPHLVLCKRPVFCSHRW